MEKQKNSKPQKRMNEDEYQELERWYYRTLDAQSDGEEEERKKKRRRQKEKDRREKKGMHFYERKESENRFYPIGMDSD